MQVSEGCIRTIYEHNSQPGESNPPVTVQVLNIKRVVASGTDRYRLILSDGKNFMQAMMSNQLNQYVISGELKKNGYIRMTNYFANAISNKKLVILLDMEVLSPFEDNHPKLGQPVGLGMSDNNNNNSNNNNPQKTSLQDQPAQQSSSAVKSESLLTPLPKQEMTDDGMPIMTIKSLSPYQNKWAIKGRVMNKSDIRTWNNQKGSGKLFNCTLVDSTGEIRLTAFNDAVDTFYDLIQEGKVYLVSNGSIKLANKSFNRTNNEYEMTVDAKSIIQLSNDNVGVPTISYNFIRDIASLQEVEKDSIIDAIGIVKTIGEVGEFVSKTTQKPYNRREITIVDASGYEIRITIFGKNSTTFSSNEGSIIAIKGARVGDFNGKSLTLLSDSTINTEPDIPEAHKLRGWYDYQGSNMNFNSFSNSNGNGEYKKSNQNKFVEQIRSEQLGQNDKPDFFTITGCINFFKRENIFYPACPSESCNKKVVQMGDSWRCEKCDMSYEKPQYRYIMSLSIADHTGTIWIQMFNDQTQELLGISADDLQNLDKDSAQFKEIFNKSLYNTFTFSIRAKSEIYQDEKKVRFTAVSCSPVDYDSACNELETLISKYEQLSVGY